MKIKTKDIIIYLSIMLAGILIGSLLLGGGHKKDATEDHSGHNHEAHEHAQEEAAPSWYTCSMHPQIQQQEPGDCPICAMELIPMSANSGISDPGVIQMTEDAIKLAQIQTSVVGKTSAQKTIRLQGKVEMDQRRNSTQTAHYSGRIETLSISFEGELVNKGQKLATIYSPELVTAQQELIQAIKTKDQYPELAEAAKNKLKLWKLSDKQIKAIEKSGKWTENFAVYADQSGYVMAKLINTGDYIKRGQAMFRIADMSHLWVMFDAYEKDLTFVKTGDEIDFTVGSFPGKTFTAKVEFIDPMMDSKRRTAAVRAEVDNTEGLLKPGMFTEGVLASGLEQKGEVIIVPRSSVMWTGKRSVVYVRYKHSDEPAFELRQVVLGETLGDNYIINSGLEEGEEVVTHGTFTVDASAQLNAKYSMMNPDPATEAQSNDYKDQIPSAFKNALDQTLGHYLKMKDYLVVDDSIKVQMESEYMLNAMDKINARLLSGEALEFYDEYMNVVKKNVEIISLSNSLIKQREVLKPLSSHYIEIIKSFGSTRSNLFVQFCPMADNDNGGHWLSTEKEIMNPYFGDMMLHCGEVEFVINE
ncbi:MAG: efflux RND transporter periplasmic adaptor subunit [Bacteroidales bacterium]|nr:efflux RND transporter periplasmic adaptor subunit [Bacteroidales bacterium]